jgi:predicted NACHT family NTPase
LHAVIIAGEVLSASTTLLQALAKALAVANYIEANAIAVKPLTLAIEYAQKKLHEHADFGGRATPVFATKGK